MTIDDLRRPLLSKMSSVLGLGALVVSDRDGVVLIKCLADDSPAEMDRLTSPAFLSRYSACVDSSSRLVDHGENEYMVSGFRKMVLVHVWMSPVVLMLVGNAEEAVVGQMLDFAKELEPLVADIAKICIRD